MTIIDIKGVRGIVPKIDPHFLSSNQPQIANNCNLSSGAIAAWNSAAKIKELAKTGEIKSTYLFNKTYWLHWNEDIDVVRGPISNNITEKTYFTGIADGMRVTDTALVDIGGTGTYPEDSYLVGVPTPATAPTAALNGTHTTPADTAYVYTFVNAWGEESAPSPVSNIVAADFTTGTVYLTGMDQTYAGDYNAVSKWRIYRIASGVSGSEYLFVAEVTPNGSAPQYNDSSIASALGEILPTEGWALPPTSLRGLVMMGNGIMAGFVGNDVYFSVPFIPYAWPTAYSLTTDYDIVGLGAYGNSLVVATKNKPYIVTGTTPESMSMDKIAHKQPCVSKRGIVSVAGGVIYPTPTCLFYIGDSGYKNITESHYSRDDWAALTPSSLFSAIYDNKYIGYLPSLAKAIAFDLGTRELSMFDQEMSSLWSDPLDDKLYLVDSTNTMYSFNADGTKYTFEYKSKKFSMKKRTLFTVGKIIANFTGQLTAAELAALEAQRAADIAANQITINAGNTKGAVNYNEINSITLNGDQLKKVPSVPTVSSFVFKLYGDGNLISEQNISSDKPFRLPSDIRYTEYEIVIFGQFAVQRIILAGSMGELNRGY